MDVVPQRSPNGRGSGARVVRTLSAWLLALFVVGGLAPEARAVVRWKVRIIVYRTADLDIKGDGGQLERFTGVVTDQEIEGLKRYMNGFFKEHIVHGSEGQMYPVFEYVFPDHPLTVLELSGPYRCHLNKWCIVKMNDWPEEGEADSVVGYWPAGGTLSSGRRVWLFKFGGLASPSCPPYTDVAKNNDFIYHETHHGLDHWYDCVKGYIKPWADCGYGYRHTRELYDFYYDNSLRGNVWGMGQGAEANNPRRYHFGLGPDAIHSGTPRFKDGAFSYDVNGGEAEDGVLSGGAFLQTNLTECTGRGCVAFPRSDDTSGSLGIELAAPGAGRYAVTVRYRTEGPEGAACELRVNGEDIGRLEFPAASNRWTTVTTNLVLRMGLNTVAFQRQPNGAEILAIDALRLLPVVPPGGGFGLKGEYFANASLDGMPSVTRLDPLLLFRWYKDSPDPSVPGTFSARWTGQVEAPYDEPYTFHIYTRHGVRLWIDNAIVIDKWRARQEVVDGWRYVQAPREWNTLGGEFKETHGAVAWYRCFVTVPADWEGHDVCLELGKIFDDNATFLNGTKIGSTDGWGKPVQYVLPGDRLRFGKPNLIAVRVVNQNHTGGIYWGVPGLKAAGKDPIALSGGREWQLRRGDDPTWAKWPGDNPESAESAALVRSYVQNGNWPIGASMEAQTEPILMKAGRKADFKLEYFGNLPTELQLDWSSPSTPRTCVPGTQLRTSGTGCGLATRIYDGASLMDLKTIKLTPAIDHKRSERWYAGPLKSLGGWTKSATDMSIRWSGYVVPLYSEDYTFTVEGNDGFRFWIEDTLAVDRWPGKTGGNGETVTVRMEAGRKYGIQFDYYNVAGDLLAKLRWSSRSQPDEYVRQSQLYSDPGFESTSIGRTAGPARSHTLETLAGYDAETYASQLNHRYTVRGGGAGVGGISDSVHFVHAKLGTAGVVFARVLDVAQLSPGGTAGLMLRESTQADSGNAYLFVTAGGAMGFQYRRPAGKETIDSALTERATTPCWLALARRADQFGAYTSSDGRRWRELARAQIAMPKTDAGLAVTSGRREALDTVVFDHADMLRFADAPFIVERATIPERRTELQVVFSAAVTRESAQTPGNYSLTDGATVQSAVLAKDARTVTLTTAPLSDDRSYTLAVQRIQTCADFLPRPMQGVVRVAVVNFLAGGGSGLRAEYFMNRDLRGPPVQVRVDPQVDYDSQQSRLPVDMSSKDRSARWTGQLHPFFSEPCTLFTVSDDGVRLWIDGKLVIDNWSPHAPTEDQATLDLDAGRKYDIKMEWFDAGSGYTARLGWFSRRQPRGAIPTNRLYPAE